MRIYSEDAKVPNIYGMLNTLLQIVIYVAQHTWMQKYKCRLLNLPVT